MGFSQLLTGMSTSNISWGWNRLVPRVDNPTTFLCRLSWILGIWSCWNADGLFSPVHGLLCVFIAGYYFDENGNLCWDCREGVANGVCEICRVEMLRKDWLTDWRTSRPATNKLKSLSSTNSMQFMKLKVSLPQSKQATLAHHVLQIF